MCEGRMTVYGTVKKEAHSYLHMKFFFFFNLCINYREYLRTNFGLGVGLGRFGSGLGLGY